MKTMICLILDRSGSMNGRENDVVGGVNKFLDEQKKLPDPACIAMVRFDTEATERFRPMTNLAETLPISLADYKPRGGTPLLDAVGSTIAALEDDWKRESPERGIVVIVTDGEENSSHEYTKAKVKDMIQARQDSGKWAFIYLGANVDAFSEASAMGISAQNTSGYQSTAKGTQVAYAAASAAVGVMRSTGATLSHNLGGNLGEDENEVKPVVPPISQKAAPTSKPWTPPEAKVWTPPQP